MNNNNLTIWMPLYVGDYLRDTRHFNVQEHGAYMLLLMAHWVRGEDGIPNSNKRLAFMASCTPAQWAKIRPTLEPLFTVSDAAWRHPRLMVEIEKRAQKSAAARKNALKRWHNTKQENTDDRPHTPPKQQRTSMQSVTHAWTAGACDAVRKRTRGL